MRYWQAFVSVLLFSFFGHAEVVERIVAVVNGKPILWSELQGNIRQFEAEMKRQGKVEALSPKETLPKRTLDQMINSELISKEVERRGLSAGDNTLDSAVTTVMQENRIRSLKDFRQALQEEGLTLEQYRNILRKQIESSRVMSEIIRPRIQINEQDIEAAYKRRVDQEPSEFKVKLAMIYKKKSKKVDLSYMQRLRRQVLAGIPFEKIAKRETEGPAKEDGGNLGILAPNDVQKELRSHVDKIKVGEVSPVIETPQGFYLLRASERVAASPRSLQEQREDIRAELTQLETERQFDAFVRQLREKAQVEVKL